MNRVRIALVAIASLLLAACATSGRPLSSAEALTAADRVIDTVWGGQATRTIESADLGARSPEIERLTDSMKSRLRDLGPYYDSGAVGFVADGYIAVRDNSRVPQPERNTLRALVANENADRATLYREFALANGEPEWEKPIRAVFARRWIERARPGWQVQVGSTWTKK